MKSKTAALAAMLFVSWTGNLLAADPSALSGTIYFHGALTAGCCELSSAQAQVNALCYRNGQYQLSRLSLNEDHKGVPEFSSTEVRWLDEAHQQGIMTITYR